MAISSVEDRETAGQFCVTTAFRLFALGQALKELNPDTIGIIRRDLPERPVTFDYNGFLEKNSVLVLKSVVPSPRQTDWNIHKLLTSKISHFPVQAFKFN